MFWIHLGSFAAYNVLIGYLLVSRTRARFSELALYGLAMGTHFLTTDFGLRSEHKQKYDSIGSWLLIVAGLTGWGLALAVEYRPWSWASFSRSSLEVQC